MKAYRISNWWRFELLKNGKLATAKTKMGAIRIKPLLYVRFPVHGHSLSSEYRRMVKRAGPELATACDGLYKMLVGLAGDQVRECRGWVMDDRQRPLNNPGQVAEILCLSEKKVSELLEILMDSEVKWVEFLDLPESICKSVNSKDLSGESQKKKSGNNQENLGKKGIAFIETETEAKAKDKLIETEGGGVRENLGGECESQGAGGGGENVQPQAQPAAQPSVSGSGTDSVPASDSEKLSDSDSDSAADSDSDSQAGPRAGPGAEDPEHLSKQKIFEIMRERNQVELEVAQILKVNPRNKSDSTTISDIYSQIAQRLIGGSPYTLFASSLATARQCWRGDKPIAMFVAAMKKPPFYYVPKKLSVIPGKFSLGKNIK